MQLPVQNLIPVSVNTDTSVPPRFGFWQNPKDSSLKIIFTSIIHCTRSSITRSTETMMQTA